MDIQGITFQENKMDMLDGVIKPVKCFKGEIPEKLRNMIGGNLYEITALLHNRGYNSVLHPIIFEIRNRIPRIVGFRKNNSGVLKEFIILTVDENECFIGELCKDDRIVDCAKETFLILSIALRKLNFWIDAMEVYTRNTEIEADEDCYVLQYDWNKTVGDAGFVIVSIGYTLEELENNGKPVPSKKTKSLIEEEKVHKFWTALCVKIVVR